MNRYEAEIKWERKGEHFVDNCYSRKHSWTFDGGLEVPAAASPHVVPKNYTDLSAIDPEEAFVASLSSCHMLWFLSLAANSGFTVEHYIDRAEGILEENEMGKIAITKVTLNPEVHFQNRSVPGELEFKELHRQAHDKCFISHSIKAEVDINPAFSIE